MTSLLLRDSMWGNGSMGRSTLGRNIVVLVAFVASTAWLSPSSFSATTECRTSPGPPAPQGQHWYYRVDRANNRYCWFLQPAAIQIRLHRTAAMPNPTAPLAGRGLSFLSSWPSAAAPTVPAEVLDREPTLSEPVAVDFTARWLDLPKSVDFDQREFPASRASYVAELEDRIEPIASTGLVTSDRRERSRHSRSAVNFGSIFLGGALSMIFFGGVLKAVRWFYDSAAWIRLIPSEVSNCADINSSDLIQALRRVDEFFKSPQSASAGFDQQPRPRTGLRSGERPSLPASP
jgi:hypothetical protein